MTISHRVKLQSSEDGYSVVGFRCPTGCTVSASYLARCPNCAEATTGAEFDGVGTVWSGTVQRIPNGDFPANRAIVFVDLDDGPRVLCEAPEVLPIGSRVRISGTGEHSQALVVMA